MIIAGLGLNSRARIEDILALIEESAALGRPESLAILAEKADSRVEAAAARLGLPLRRLPSEALQAVAGRALTHSPRLAARSGGASLAECAALAAGGEGARLVAPRVVGRNVTLALCTISRKENASKRK